MPHMTDNTTRTPTLPKTAEASDTAGLLSAKRYCTVSIPQRKPLRIVHVSPTSNLFGSERSLLEQFRTIDRRRFLPYLVTLVEGPFEEAARAEGIPVDRLSWLTEGSCRHPLQWLRTVARFTSWLREARIDIVELNLLLFGLPDLGMLSTATRFAGAKFVLRNRLSAYWLSLYDKFWVSRADVIISVSRGAIEPWLKRRRSDLWSRIRPERIYLVPSGRNVSELETIPRNPHVLRSLGIPEDARVVGMVAGITPNKRHDIFLKAAQLIRHQCHDTWFVIVGASYSERERYATYEAALREMIV